MRGPFHSFIYLISGLTHFSCWSLFRLGTSVIDYFISSPRFCMQGMLYCYMAIRLIQTWIGRKKGIEWDDGWGGKLKYFFLINQIWILCAAGLLWLVWSPSEAPLQPLCNHWRCRLSRLWLKQILSEKKTMLNMAMIVCKDMINLQQKPAERRTVGRWQGAGQSRWIRRPFCCSRGGPKRRKKFLPPSTIATILSF